jgi:hypothetical protein
MRTSFTISLKRSTLSLQLSTSWQADYPIFWHGAANHVLIGDGRFWGEADMPRTAMLPGGVKINE